MFEMTYKTPEIENASKDGKNLVLVADIREPFQLFQGQTFKIKTGTAIKSDQHVFACPLDENNRIGLVMGSGIELLDTEDGDEVELTLWNRNVPGQQRMIEIQPGMAIAQLTVMPKYCTSEVVDKQPEKNPTAASKTGTGKPGRPAKPKPAAAKAESKTGTDG